MPALIVIGRKKVSENSAGEKKSNSCNPGKGGVQEPELRGRHFFKKAANPAHEIICAEEGEIVDADDRSR